MPEKPELICMMGLPRSGKSTAAMRLSWVLGAPVVNRDSIRLALHGQRYVKEAEPMVKAVAKIMVKALFKAGHRTVIVDETNLKTSTRDFWHDEEWRRLFLPVSTTADVCLKRAAATEDETIRPIILSMTKTTESLHGGENKYDIVSRSRTKTGLVEVIELIRESEDGEDLE